MLTKYLAAVLILTGLGVTFSGAPVMAEPDSSVQSDAQKKESTPPPTGFIWADGGPSFRVKNLRVDLKGRLQENVQRSYENADVTAGLSTFELQRARIGIEGRLFAHIDFEVEREFSEDELTPEEVAEGLTQKPPWKDVYVDFGYLRSAQAQIGRYKIPFGLDQLTSVTRNDFVYRSLAGEYLAPGRDTGVTLHGRFFNRGLNYWAGVFQHDGDNARSKKIQGGDTTLAVRVTSEPFRATNTHGLGALEVGGAYALTTLSDDPFRPNGLRARTVVTEEAFFDAVYVDGRRHRWEGDLEWFLGPMSLRGEYTHVTDDRLGQGLSGEDLSDARYQSLYGSATYVLTGEPKTRPLKPARPFLQGGAGAFEIAARFERLWCDSVSGGTTPFRNPRAATILPSGDRILTIGANWVLNRWVTVQVNGIRELIEDPQRNPAPEAGAFWSRVLRLQVVL